jgi:hypothetical protein
MLFFFFFCNCPRNLLTGRCVVHAPHAEQERLSRINPAEEVADCYPGPAGA